MSEKHTTSMRTCKFLLIYALNPPLTNLGVTEIALGNEHPNILMRMNNPLKGEDIWCRLIPTVSDNINF